MEKITSWITDIGKVQVKADTYMDTALYYGPNDEKLPQQRKFYFCFTPPDGHLINNIPHRGDVHVEFDPDFSKAWIKWSSTYWGRIDTKFGSKEAPTEGAKDKMIKAFTKAAMEIVKTPAGRYTLDLAELEEKESEIQQAIRKIEDHENKIKELQSELSTFSKEYASIEARINQKYSGR